MVTCGAIVSINVGLPREYDSAATDDPDAFVESPPPADKFRGPWITGFFKQPVAGPVVVHLTNLSGDGQADRRVHGGPDKAVLAYAADHYPVWRLELGEPGLSFGAFGENLSIADVTERDVCIGDVWIAGDVRLQVSQPRQPCWKLARRWHRPDLPRRVVQTNRTGWYFRVLQTGVIEAGQAISLSERPHEAWTVERCNDAMYRQAASRAELMELMSLPELSDAWKHDLA